MRFGVSLRRLIQPRNHAEMLKSALTMIQNSLGLHARPAMAFVDLATQFACEVRVRRTDDDEQVDGKSIMQMLLLAATQGTQLEITCQGSDAERAIHELVRLVECKFDEE